MERRASETGKITHIKNIHVESIKETGKKIVLSCIGPENIFNLDADYIISAIGRQPCQEFLDEGLIKNSRDLQNEKLLYFIGDVSNGSYRQTSVATGDGIKAAMKIYDFFNET